MPTEGQSDESLTEFELRAQERLKKTREGGNKQKIVELEALLAEQGKFRQEAESMARTLNGIQRSVLLRVWGIPHQKAQARFEGFWWGALTVGVLWWFLTSGAGELARIFSGDFGLPLAAARLLSLLVGGIVLLLLVQKGMSGFTFIHLILTWFRKRQ